MMTHSNSLYGARARFIRASDRRFADWGKGGSHRKTGAALQEFHDLFVLTSSYYQRLKWLAPKKQVWYRTRQVCHDQCERYFGSTPYGKMVRAFSGKNW